MLRAPLADIAGFAPPLQLNSASSPVSAFVVWHMMAFAACALVELQSVGTASMPRRNYSWAVAEVQGGSSFFPLRLNMVIFAPSCLAER